MFKILPIAILALFISACSTTKYEISKNSPDLAHSEFYKKSTKIKGFSIVASEKVSDVAIKEAAYLVENMIGHRPEVLQELTKNRVRLVVMAYNEMTCDLPEHAELNTKYPYQDWNLRARGLGATASHPIVSCAEENLLCFPSDPYSYENIMIHEFAHAIQDMAIRSLIPDFNLRLLDTYNQAIAEGLWKGTYAGSNFREYWAEGVQKWFDYDDFRPPVHNSINTRAKLIEYDPRFVELIKEVFGDRDWVYKKPLDRPEVERRHFEDYDFSNQPIFKYIADPNYKKK